MSCTTCKKKKEHKRKGKGSCKKNILLTVNIPESKSNFSTAIVGTGQLQTGGADAPIVLNPGFVTFANAPLLHSFTTLGVPTAYQALVATTSSNQTVFTLNLADGVVAAGNLVFSFLRNGTSIFLVGFPDGVLTSAIAVFGDGATQAGDIFQLQIIQGTLTIPANNVGGISLGIQLIN